ncbi:pentapeptide repeat-containing protein [Actibacterium sp.]|uniref:pentapeptide repeat-containing protein n=1 Tax=Actibacterium sp. TaxID=1872125 RepID=UPI003561E248
MTILTRDAEDTGTEPAGIRIADATAFASAKAGLAARPDALHKADLSEADLAGADLSEVDLTRADFFKADLTRANLKKARLALADLSMSKMQGTALYKADLTGATLQEADLQGADLSASSCRGGDFRGANLRGANLADADLRGCNFSHCDMSGVNLTGANVTGAHFHFAQLTDANVTHIKYGTFKDLVGCYYGVRGIDSTYGNALFVRDARDQDYIDTLFRSIQTMPPGPVKRLEQLLFRAWGLIDHGRSLMKVSFYAFLIAMSYGLFYCFDMALGWGIMDYSSSAETWFTPFYYSVVTYTTLGFGDVTANSLFGEMLVISEVVVGYFTLGLLLAILANTIARRS